MLAKVRPKVATIISSKDMSLVTLLCTHTIIHVHRVRVIHHSLTIVEVAIVT